MARHPTAQWLRPDGHDNGGCVVEKKHPIQENLLDSHQSNWESIRSYVHIVTCYYNDEVVWQWTHGERILLKAMVT
jgi:hypothetical protein